MNTPTTTNEKAPKPEPVTKPKYKKVLGLKQLQNGAGPGEAEAVPAGEQPAKE